MNPFSWGIRYWRTAALTLGIGVIALAFYNIGTKTAANKESIEKSCILLNNLVFKVSLLKPSQSQVIARQTLIHVMTADQRDRYLAALSAERGHTLLPPLPCRKVASDPGSIKAPQTR